MIGLGTILNAAGILLGGVLGLLFRRGLKEKYQKTMICACGVSVIFIGAAGTLQGMLVIENGALASTGTMLLIASLVLGGLVGEWIDLEEKTERFGRWLKVKTGSQGDAAFVDGFVTASLTVCVGAMAVVGAIADGLTGDYSILLTKAILDAIIILVMTASRGKGCIFSVIPVVVIQGSITLFASVLSPLLTDEALGNLSLVGSALIFCVGINLVFGNRIRVANLLPGLIVAVAWAFLPI